MAQQGGEEGYLQQGHTGKTLLPLTGALDHNATAPATECLVSLLWSDG